MTTQTPDAVREAAIEFLANEAERAGCVELPKGLRGGDVALLSSEIAVSAILAALDSRAGDAGEVVGPPGFQLEEVEQDAECGCPEETWATPYGLLNMHLSATGPSNAYLDNGDEGEWETEATFATVAEARAAFFGWAIGLYQALSFTPAPAVDAVPAGEVERMARIRTSMALLQQNSEMCARNHYDNDDERFGMPGWLIDTKADLDDLTDILAAISHGEGRK